MTRARSGVLVTAVLLVAGWLAPVPASADPWRFEGGGTTPLFVDVIQSGGTISFSYKGGSFAGSLSPGGDFTADAAPAPSLPCGADMNGHILASGKTLYARLLEYVPGGSPGSCNGYPPYITEVVGIRCGCFDGNAADGDGCSAACQVEPCFTCSGLPSVCVPSLPVAACDDGSVCTTGETCSVGGACGGGSPVVPCVDLTGDWTVHGDAGPYGTADSSAAITQRDMDVVFRDSTSGAPGYVGTVFPTHGRFRARGGN